MNKIIKIIVELSRVLIGGVFIFSGFVKSVDPIGSMLKIDEYLAFLGLEQFAWAGIILSFILSSIEFAVGICILLAVYRKWISLVALLFMIIMTPLTLYLALYNPVADCGCFGDALVITNWQTFYKNLVLLLAAIIMVVFGKRVTLFYSSQVHWFVLVFSFFFCIGFCYWNYAHLPVIDFRPYKVGENILKLMEIPENAPQDEYVFIYSKDGKQKEFFIDSLPDSTWIYVDSKLIKQGYIPIINSFELYDENFENVGEDILHRTEPVLLIVAPKLEEASDKHADWINNIYDTSLETKTYSLYCLTSSSIEAITEWKKNTGADYPFLIADDVLLKTMIRANPGLVLLLNGTILGKWHHNDFPDDEELSDIIAKYHVNNYDNSTSLPQKPFLQKGNFFLYIISTFALPLLLIWIYDRIIIIRRSKNK